MKNDPTDYTSMLLQMKTIFLKSDFK